MRALCVVLESEKKLCLIHFIVSESESTETKTQQNNQRRMRPVFCVNVKLLMGREREKENE